MKYCPNPQCVYALNHHEAAEYRDEAVTCSDCGAELTAVPPVSTPAVAKPGNLRWDKIATTLFAPLLVVWLGPKLPLPALDLGRIEETLGAFASETNLSVLALGLGPMVSASVLVELAALAVPRWRLLRIGGPSGRGQLLRATGRVALALAAVQALGLTLYMEKLGLLDGNVRLGRLLIVLTLVAGTFALVVLAQLLDRAALGGGFSLLVTAFALPSLGPFAAEAWRIGHAGSGQATPLVGALLLVCAGTAFFLGWPPLGAEGRRSALPRPACGVIPLKLAAASVTAAIAGSALGPGLLPALTGENGAAVTLTLTAGFAVGLGYLFNRPSRVEAFAPDARARVRRAVIQSTGYVLGLGILGWFIGRQLDLAPGPEPLNLVPLVMVVAVCLDVIAEARTVRRHGELVPVWPEHRLYAVEGVQQALDRGGIPSLARSVHQRALWHFFAPFIPIQIMVPRPRAEEAGQLLLEYFAARAAVEQHDVERVGPDGTHGAGERGLSVEGANDP